MTPDEHVRRQEEAHNAISGLLQKYMDEHEGSILLHELGTWLYVILWRTRQALTFNELGTYIVNLMHVTEHALMVAKEDLGSDLLLAEDWKGISGGGEMLNEMKKLNQNSELTIPDWMLEEE